VDANDVRAAIDTAIERAVAVSCGKPMEWGIDDCVLWAANILWPIVGFDPAAEFRGRYRDESAAYGLVSRLGLAMTVARAARDLGWPRIDPLRAQVGDVGIVRSLNGPACVLFWRADQWVGPLDYGFATVHRAEARFAWSIG